MSKSIFHKLICYQIRKAENKTRNKRFVNLADVKSMHILLGASDLSPIQSEQFYRQVYEMIDWLQKQPYQVQVTIYVRKMPVEAKRFHVNIFDNKKISWCVKRPKKEVMAAFNETKSDVLLNLSSELAYPLEYLAAASDASLKIGLKVDDRPLPYDFQLQVEDMQQEMLKKLQAVLFYLEKIQSN